MANFFIYKNACYTFTSGQWYITERNAFSNANRTGKIDRSLVLIAARGLYPRETGNQDSGKRLVENIEHRS